MTTLHAHSNVGVANGCWGEEVAAGYLRRKGYVIVERNVRPVERDHRLEIDIIAWDRESDAIVFVEVKQHAKISPYARRMRSVDREKLKNLRRACNSWRRHNKWEGGYRFDVIEIYGTPESGAPLIDHIPRVNLFVKRANYVDWQ